MERSSAIDRHVFIEMWRKMIDRMLITELDPASMMGVGVPQAISIYC